MGEEKMVMGNFSLEEEELLRKFIFTNPHEDVSFIYPQPLVASEELSPLMSAYSRTHMPMQERVLQFLDRDKTEQTKAMLQYIPGIISTFREEDGTLKMSAKTAMFNKQWPLKHGHSSIKEETGLFGHNENISDIAGKKVTGHPLCKPQVKSTRYISFGKTLDLSLKDPDLLSFKNNSKVLKYVAWMNKRYLEVSEKLGDLVYSHKYTNEVVEYLKMPENVEKEVEKRINERREIENNFIPSTEDYEKERRDVLKALDDKSVRRDVGKFVLDYSRAYLLAATRTSQGYSVDARTLEEIITDMISSPRIEDRERGNAIWNEAKKIAPVLLGEKAHIKIDQWKVKNEIEFREYAETNFKIKNRNHFGETIKLYHPKNIEMYTDKFNAALVLFPYLDGSLGKINNKLLESDVEEILERAHKYRSEHDVLHPAISHGGLIPEILMEYGGYRDLYRQRRGSRSNQLLTTRLGFAIPKIFKVFGLDKEYLQDMIKVSEMYEEVRDQSVHTGEKVVPFGAKCRSIHSWQTNQMGYVGRLRSDMAKGNSAYVYTTREMMDKVAEIMPKTAKYFKVNRKDYPAELWKAGYEWYDKTQR